MDAGSTRALLAHGALILLVGVLAGHGYWLALVTRRTAARANAWRVAHATLLGVGLTMLAAGLLGTRIAPGPGAAAARLLVLAGWSFAFALIGGAVTGIRGLTPRPWGLGTVLFAGHLLGAVGSTLGVALLAWGLLARPT